MPENIRLKDAEERMKIAEKIKKMLMFSRKDADVFLMISGKDA